MNQKPISVEELAELVGKPVELVRMMFRESTKVTTPQRFSISCYSTISNREPDVVDYCRDNEPELIAFAIIDWIQQHPNGRIVIAKENL